ncbi:MAG: hypothetical protein COB39_14165 [Marinosulfonomonas sp.]|nr:MAG: hypothetical protein COB39_14165 [Marinosulfonomonas sp.]
MLIVMMSITSPQAYGAGLRASEVTRLHVPHLAPHILTLPKGDRVNIIVGYSSHCWTRTFDPAAHRGQMQIMDGIRPRAFCPGAPPQSPKMSNQR